MTTSVTRHPTNEANCKHYWDAKKRLEAAGWRQLGSGCSGAVYTHPDCPETVLKVGHNGHNDGWLNYILSSRKSRSPHTPKIYALEIRPNYYYAEMERLEPIYISEWQDHDLDVDGDVGPRSPLRAYIRRCERLRKRFGNRADYHAGNFMRRPSTGDLVCTDPWA